MTRPDIILAEVLELVRRAAEAREDMRAALEIERDQELAQEVAELSGICEALREEDPEEGLARLLDEQPDVLSLLAEQDAARQGELTMNAEDVLRRNRGRARLVDLIDGRDPDHTEANRLRQEESIDRDEQQAHQRRGDLRPEW